MTGPVPGARAILAALLLFGAALPAMERGLWYAHAGTRVYPDQVVPTTWDAGTGTNIRWKTPLPNWSNGSPLLVRGRLFVLSEPLGYAPLLTCIDADSGERLWQREVDPIACFPEEDRQRLRRLAGEGWAWNRGMTALCNDIMTHLATTFPGYRPRRGKPDPEHVKSVETAFGERLQALGLRFDGFAAGVGGWTTSLPFIDERGPEARREQELHELGLRWERWSHYGTWTGSTYGTPACDGERVFIATGNNHFSCYDLAGELLWQHRFPWPGSRQPTRLIPEAHRPRIGTVPPGDPGRFSSEWPFDRQGLTATSPIAVDGTFISCHAAYIRCFEAATGALRWSLPMRGGIGQNCMTPDAIALGGESFVIVPTGDPRYPRYGVDGDDIIRVRDGRICGILPGVTCSKRIIAGPIVAGDLVANYLGDGRKPSDIGVHRLGYDAGSGTVACELLWKKAGKEIRGVSLWRACVHDGTLYHGGTAVELLTGKTIATGLPDAEHKSGFWSGMVIGPHYLAIAHHQGRFLFRDLATGKAVGEAVLPRHNPEVHDEGFIKAEERGSRWSVLGAATPIAHDNRLYVRAYDYLWCIGH